MGVGRVSHVLRENTSCERPTRLLFVDIESRLSAIDTARTAHKLWFGWSLFWRRRPERDKDTLRWQRFTQAEAFWDYVVAHTKIKEPLYLIAHNVNYDFGVLRMFDSLSARDYKLSSFYSAGHTSIIKFKSKAKTIIVLDNGNYFPGALAVWGEAVGYPKLDVDPLTATEDEADPYCKRDTEIMYRLWANLFRFLDDNNLGSWGVTLPSQAFRAYRHRFMHERILIHDNERAIELEREAYHGGRTSVFWQGTRDDGPFYKLDVNSMYPYVMHKSLYPSRLYHLAQPSSLNELEDKLSEFCLIARVEVSTPEPCFSVLSHGHLIHPIGRFVVSLCTPEIQYAVQHDYIKDVECLAWYKPAPLFKSYVDFFYRLKLDHSSNKNDPYYSFAKLYLNSLYGKFAQRAQIWREASKDEVIDSRSEKIVVLSENKTYWIHRFGDMLWQHTDGGESYNSAPAIAAHVTAEARMYLWSLISLAGREHVLYCDTDSLIVDGAGLDKMAPYISPVTLGALKVEKESSEVTIWAPKCYSLSTETRRKGIPSKAQQLDNNTWTFDKFPSFLTQSRWPSDTQFHTVKASRSLSYKITDGHVSARGWIIPLRADEISKDLRMTQESTIELSQIEAQISALRQSLLLPASILFKLWNYKSGTFKRHRQHNGNLTAIEYSSADSLATELGYTDLNALENAVRDEIARRSAIRSLERKARELKTQPLNEDIGLDPEPVPF